MPKVYCSYQRTQDALLRKIPQHLVDPNDVSILFGLALRLYQNAKNSYLIQNGFAYGSPQDLLYCDGMTNEYFEDIIDQACLALDQWKKQKKTNANPEKIPDPKIFFRNCVGVAIVGAILAIVLYIGKDFPFQKATGFVDSIGNNIPLK